MLGLGSGPPRASARPLSIVQPSFQGLVNSFQRLCISSPTVQSPPRGLVIVGTRSWRSEEWFPYSSIWSTMYSLATS